MKRYKKLLFIAFAMIFAFIATACSSKDDTKDGGNASTGGDSAQSDTINIRMVDDPDFLDPHLATASITFQMILNMYEGLLAAETDGTMKPAIAEDYDISDDGLTYTFQIRDGVKFHNGNDVTVEDIQYSFDRLLGADGGDALTSEFDSIESLYAPDESTFVIALKEPNSNFIYTLTALNAAIIPESNDETQNETPIGTGPFKFENYSPGMELVLEKNENYWQEGLPKLNKVNFKFHTDDETAMLAMQSGELDMMEIPAHRISEVENDYNLEYQESNSAVVVGFNNEKEPFDDVKVRQAISYAINEEDIIDSAFSGYAVKLGSHMSPAMGDFYLEGLEDTYDTDVEKAKELLAEAGYPDGFDTTITISSHRTMYSDIAQVAVENLREIGINAEIEVVEWGIWLERVYDNRDYDLTAINITGRPSAYEILNDYMSTNEGENYFQYENKDFDEVMEQALLEPELEDQITQYHKAQEILTEDAASVFVADNQFIWMINPAIEGINYYPFYFHDMSEATFGE